MGQGIVVTEQDRGKNRGGERGKEKGKRRGDSEIWEIDGSYDRSVKKTEGVGTDGSCGFVLVNRKVQKLQFLPRACYKIRPAGTDKTKLLTGY